MQQLRFSTLLSLLLLNWEILILISLMGVSLLTITHFKIWLIQKFLKIQSGYQGV